MPLSNTNIKTQENKFKLESIVGIGIHPLKRSLIKVHVIQKCRLQNFCVGSFNKNMAILQLYSTLCMKSCLLLPQIFLFELVNLTSSGTVEHNM